MNEFKPAMGRNARDLLVKAGLLSEEDRAERVVIDINTKDVVRVWVQKIADERLLAVLDPITRLGVEEHHAGTE